MMSPGASVSGMYIGNPHSKYFAIGMIGEDQVRHYARRKGVSVETASKHLSSNILYK